MKGLREALNTVARAYHECDKNRPDLAFEDCPASECRQARAALGAEPARPSPFDLIRQGINRNRHNAVNAVREPGAAGWNRGLDRALAVIDQIEKEAHDDPRD